MYLAHKLVGRRRDDAERAHPFLGVWDFPVLPDRGQSKRLA